MAASTERRRFPFLFRPRVVEETDAVAGSPGLESVGSTEEADTPFTYLEGALLREQRRRRTIELALAVYAVVSLIAIAALGWAALSDRGTGTSGSLEARVDKAVTASQEATRAAAEATSAAGAQDPAVGRLEHRLAQTRQAAAAQTRCLDRAITALQKDLKALLARHLDPNDYVRSRSVPHCGQAPSE